MSELIREVNQELTVVAIDDDVQDLALLRRTMTSFEDIKLVCFDNLDSGIRHLQEHQCDLFLLDYFMPPNDGIESMEILRKHCGSTMPVIIVTGQDDTELYKKVISLGAQDCISKNDLTGNQLYRAIRNASERQKLQEQLRHSASTDYVTGLPNRCAMMEEVNARLRNNELFNLLVIDLDNFKSVNDGYGHDTGDVLLRKLAELLTELARPKDHLSRFGGDEFVFIRSGESSEEELSDFVQTILARLKEGTAVGGTAISSSASIGIAKSKGFLGDATTLLRDADTAMFEAKSLGKSTHACFDYSMKKAVRDRVDLERGIRQAIHNEELELHYQPIFHLETYEITGCEALLRWKRAGGYVVPEKLIRVSEQTGYIHEIGNWVFVSAVEQAARWRQIAPSLDMHINVSPMQLLRDQFVQLAQRTAASSEIPPQQIVIEITESKELEDRSNSIEQIRRLKRMGFRISLDDFGTGYSSLGHLHRLPIDEVKIDKSFIGGLDDASSVESTEYCTAFVSAINALSTSIGLGVIAEGIETQMQIELLRETGYTQGQGYLFAKPMRAEAMESLLLKQRDQAADLKNFASTSLR